MKRTLGLAAMLFLAVTGCSTNKHMLEPGVDKRADVSPEMHVHRHPSSAHPASDSLIGDADGPCTYLPPQTGEVIERVEGEDGIDVYPDGNVIP